MAPWIVGIDRRRQSHERFLDPYLVESLGFAHPRDVVADVHAIDEPPADLAGIGNVTRLDGESELVDELTVGRVPRPEHLAAGLDHAPVRQRHRLDSATDPVPCLEHDHIRSRALQVARGAQSRQSRPQHRHVDHAR